jgi:hypothetical protein
LVLLSAEVARAADEGPAYQIVLRSRRAQVLPSNDKRAQTGGGSIVVEQPEPNTIVVTMGGSAVAGSAKHATTAGLTFELAQDLDIIPMRANVRPPRIGMIGRVVGTLQVTDPGKFGCPTGNAQQGPAAACLSSAGVSILSLDVEPSAVACGQKLSINNQSGPVESSIFASRPDAGCFLLAASFAVCANQEAGVFNRRFAVADFDPAPQLDAFWADALKPFRAVPRNEFGYKLVLRVVEDAVASNTQN